MRRALLILLLACLAPLAAALPATAAPTSDLPSVAALSALWSKIFETPSSRNPFGSGGDAYSCLTLVPGVVAPFGAGPVPACSVKRGTTLVVTPWTYECSTFEGATRPELATCAKSFDAGISTTLSVDGKTAVTHEVQTILIPIVLPRDNIFGAPAGATGWSVGHGWVAILKPLSPGVHVIHLTAAGPNTSVDTTTLITVRA